MDFTWCLPDCHALGANKCGLAFVRITLEVVALYQVTHPYIAVAFYNMEGSYNMTKFIPHKTCIEQLASIVAWQDVLCSVRLPDIFPQPKTVLMTVQSSQQMSLGSKS